MSLTQFKVLTFDVVGTLIDFERGMLDYLRQAVPGSDVSDSAFLAAYREARKRPGTLAYPDDLVPVWHLIAPQLGLPDTEALAQGFRDSVAHWPAFPDSVAALQRLKRRFRLVTMTNAQRWALVHFSRTLGDPFDLLISADEALCEKPDPRYFAYARGCYQTLWGFGQGDNLHVAQSQYHDIGVSKRLGITTCWIERRHGQKDSGGTIESAHTVPDHHFHGMTALADAVEAEAQRCAAAEAPEVSGQAPAVSRAGGITVLRQSAQLGGLVDEGSPLRPIGEPVCALSGHEVSLAGAEGHATGLWACTPGRFERQLAQAEVMHILAGRCTFTPTGGQPLDIRAGDTLFFPAHTTGVWDVQDTLRKVYVVMPQG